MASPEKDFSTLDPALALGTTHQGFEVVASGALPELSGCWYQLRHQASGARLLWLSNADANRSFSIAFKTPPADDTGVFHILEHSVLCGSDRFPVKEPFVNLLKTSMQTFLNALTFRDKTMYPVASTNVADLENLMDVYLDAVLHPAIYHRPRIFEQEGWHLELDSPDAPLTYNGVVLNEMKGVFSDPADVAFLDVSRQLFPDSPYGFESGGAPRAIPTLTYEGFLDHHKRHYNLANSYTILYGDLDIERELAFIDRRFQGAETRNAGAPNPLPAQAPVSSGLHQVRMATGTENASVSLGYVIGTYADRERMLATDVLFDALCGSNEAPLKRRILDERIADDFSAQLVDGELQPQLVMRATGTRGNVAERLRSLVLDTCRELARDGLPKDRLRAAIAQAEFNLREQDWGYYPNGVFYSIMAMSSWLYDDARPVDYLRYEDALASLKAGLEGDYFEHLLQELVCDNPHTAFVELVPVDEGDAADEAAELAAIKAGMNDEQLAAVIANVEALRAEQEAEDAPEDLARLPRLRLEDIGDAAPEPQGTHVQAPLPCIAHELDTHKIDYAYHYFGLSALPFDDLPYVGVLAELLGKLDTALHSAADLDTVLEERLGGLSLFVETYAPDDEPEKVSPKLVVSASALSDNVCHLATLPAEVWESTDFSDTGRIHDVLVQQKKGMEVSFLGSGHAAALARVATYFSPAAKVTAQMVGLDYYLFLKALLDEWDSRKDSLPAKLSQVAATVFTADDVLVSFTGSADDRARFWEAGGTLGLSPTPGGAEARLVAPTPEPANEGFVIDSNVSFVATGAPVSLADYGKTGVWHVAQRALSYDYLWNEVRVKGGAYGVGFRHSTTGLLRFHSYRDPQVDATIRRYDAAADWLAQAPLTDDEMCGYVVSTIASHDYPVKARSMARRQDQLELAGRPEGWRDMVRAQELATTADQVRALALVLRQVAERRAICVFGPREALLASTHDLVIHDVFGDDED